ncbi:MAG: oxidoreductase [Chitinophagaceae bacterium]|nr:oxidoreductase [Chitinophagaceae bacterium]
MRLIKIFSLSICTLTVLFAKCQYPKIEILQSGNKISLRGLSVVNDQTIWASGNKGTVARSIDGGKNFEWIKVAGYETRDFRDIEAFDPLTAIIMGVDAPAIILKTRDGGKTWKKVLEDSTKGMFLDAMDFSDAKNAVVIGDPIDQKIYLATTKDLGNNWTKLNAIAVPEDLIAKEGEAFFASSGTNIKMLNGSLAFVTGGKSSRLFYAKSWNNLSLQQGMQSTGANSIAIHKNKYGVIVGGDFTKDTVSFNNCVLFEIQHQNIKFSKPITNPHGYRSCVIYINKNELIACGTSGIDISKDGGKNWELVSKESFHVVQKAPKSSAVFLAGSNGRIAKLMF